MKANEETTADQESPLKKSESSAAIEGLDRFSIIEKIAEGGMGAVYKAEDSVLRKVVALKLLKTDAMDGAHLLRFQNEARTLSKLSQPGIAAVYDCGVSKKGQPFIAMEYVDGITLSRLLDERIALPWREAMPIFMQICDVLSYTHNKGIIHRDVQPSNIMLVSNASNSGWLVKLVDFGIARDDEGYDSGRLTRRGSWIGNPLYMSPEQSGGKRVSIQSDMYSLGCVMFHCLVGKPPYRGDTAFNTITMHQKEPVPALINKDAGLEVPPELERIVQNLLAKDANKRFASMKDVRDALDHVLNGPPGDQSIPASAGRQQTQDGAPAAPEPVLNIGRTKGIALVLVIFIPLVLAIGCTLIPWILKDQTANPQIGLNDAELSSIAENLKSGVTVVNLEGSNINNDQLSIFESDNQVKQLNLASTKITNEGLKHLSRLKLARLILKETRIRSLDNLPSRDTLKNLDVSKTDIDDKAIPILQSFTHLQKLNVSNTSISVPALLELSPNLKLTSLRLQEVSRPDLFRLQHAFPFCFINQNNSLVETLLHKLDSLLQTKKWDKAQELCSDGLRLAESRADIKLQLFYMTATAYCLDAMAKQTEADAMWKKAMTFGEQHELRDQLELTYRFYFYRSAELHRAKEMVWAANKAVDNFAYIEDDALQSAEYCSMFGSLLAKHGLGKEALQLLDKSMAIQKRAEVSKAVLTSLDRDPWLDTMSNKNILYLRTRRRMALAEVVEKHYETAEAYINETQHLLARFPNVLATPDAIALQSVRAELALAKGNPQEALKLNDQSMQTIEAKPMLKEYCFMDVLELRIKILKALKKTAELQTAEAQYKLLGANAARHQFDVLQGLSR